MDGWPRRRALSGRGTPHVHGRTLSCSRASLRSYGAALRGSLSPALRARASERTVESYDAKTRALEHGHGSTHEERARPHALQSREERARTRPGLPPGSRDLARHDLLVWQE